MAHLMHRQAGHKKAEEHLLQAEHIGRRMGSKSIGFACLLAEAQFAVDSSNDGKGLKFLSDAMTLGKKQGYVNFSWWQDTVMARLCAKALEHNIEVEYVEMLIRKRKLAPPQSSPYPLQRGTKNWPYPIKIYTHGRFEIVIDGKPLVFSGKVQKRPLEMLKLIIALGGKDVPKEKVADELWPDVEGDKAHSNFEMTLSRLRKLIGDESIELKGGMVSLDPRMVWVEAATPSKKKF